MLHVFFFSSIPINAVHLANQLYVFRCTVVYRYMCVCVSEFHTQMLALSQTLYSCSTWSICDNDVMYCTWWCRFADEVVIMMTHACMMMEGPIKEIVFIMHGKDGDYSL